jgi:hypothetical protein
MLFVLGLAAFAFCAGAIWQIAQLVYKERQWDSCRNAWMKLPTKSTLWGLHLLFNLSLLMLFLTLFTGECVHQNVLNHTMFKSVLTIFAYVAGTLLFISLETVSLLHWYMLFARNSYWNGASGEWKLICEFESNNAEKIIVFSHAMAAFFLPVMATMGFILSLSS